MYVFRDQQIKMSTWMHNLNNKLLFKCRGAIWDASHGEEGACHSAAQKINKRSIYFFFNKKNGGNTKDSGVQSCKVHARDI